MIRQTCKQNQLIKSPNNPESMMAASQLADADISKLMTEMSNFEKSVTAETEQHLNVKNHIFELAQEKDPRSQKMIGKTGMKNLAQSYKKIDYNVGRLKILAQKMSFDSEEPISLGENKNLGQNTQSKRVGEAQAVRTKTQLSNMRTKYFSKLPTITSTKDLKSAMSNGLSSVVKKATDLKKNNIQAPKVKNYSKHVLNSVAHKVQNAVHTIKTNKHVKATVKSAKGNVHNAVHSIKTNKHVMATVKSAKGNVHNLIKKH